MEMQQTIQDWSFGSARVRWGPLAAALVVSLAAQILLTVFGLAVGLSSFDVRAEGQGVSIGTGVWTGISLLVSIGIGGFLAARLSSISLRSDGIYNGIVLWGVTWLMFAWLATSAMAALLGGVFNVFGATMQGIGTAATAVATRTADGSVNVSTGDLRRQIESILQATEKPDLQPAQIKKDAESLKGQAQQGQPVGKVTDGALQELQQQITSLDREAAVNVMVNKFGMKEPQAQELINSTMGMGGLAKEKAGELKEQSATMATTAVNKVGTAAWLLLILALLSLGASVGGGILGASNAGRIDNNVGSFQSKLERSAAHGLT